MKISRSYRNYLSARQVTLCFITKVVFGIIYGFLFYKFYNGDDTWLYHNYSLIEYHNILNHPLEFFQDLRIKTGGSASLHALYNTTNSFWNKLDDALFVKLLAIFNLFSFGHYYVNVVLFCFLVFLGNLLLYRLFIHYYPKSARLLTIAIFYMPMPLFWLSGIRKEGILFLALAVVLFYFDRLMRTYKKWFFHSIYFLSGLAVLLLLRNFMVMCIAPSLMAWFICHRFKWNAPLTFATVYLGSIIIFFSSELVPGLPDLAGKVTERQHEFMGLIAKTRLPLDSLKGTPLSYFHVLPQAMNHAFFQPYISESKGMLQVISAADVLLFFLLLSFAIIFHKHNLKRILQNPLVLTCLFTSFFAYLLIGFTVPFPGAFVRYKAIFELLFFCLFAVAADLDRIPMPGISKKKI